MTYGTYDRFVVDSSNDDHGMDTAIQLEATVGAILLKTIREPMRVARFGFMPTELFDYETLTTKGVLTLYKYPLGVAANKVALATINLEDGDLAGKQYVCDPDNLPVAATSPYAGLDERGVCDLNPGDQVAVWITTQAVGTSYIAGDFQPFVYLFPRAEGEGNEDYLVNRTPTKTAVSSNIHAA
jgi:hypothetical protein